VTCAATNYGQIKAGNFRSSPTSDRSNTGAKCKEFIVQIPEPATIVLLLMGIDAMFVLGLKRQRQQVAAEFSEPKIST
jgi:PEP-CTERM motif